MVKQSAVFGDCIAVRHAGDVVGDTPRKPCFIHAVDAGTPLLRHLRGVFQQRREEVAHDRERFESAASALGVSASDEPVTRVVFDYEDEVTPSRAAAELGLSEAEFSVLLPVFSSKQLSTNFPLERDQFNVDFLGYACESQRALENIPAGCEGA